MIQNRPSLCCSALTIENRANRSEGGASQLAFHRLPPTAPPPLPHYPTTPFQKSHFISFLLYSFLPSLGEAGFPAKEIRLKGCPDAPPKKW